MTRDEATRVVRQAKANWSWITADSTGPIKWNTRDLKELIDAAMLLTEAE